MEETVKQNILNSLTWFYEQLRQRIINPIITMLMTGESYGWLMDEDGNIIMADDDNGILLSWKLYEHNMIADDFDKSATYQVGDFCVYDNLLYKFTEIKYAGEWDASIVSRVNITSELKNFENEYQIQTTSTLSTLNVLRDDVDDNQGDIQTLQGDMEEAQQDIQTLQTQFEEEQSAIQTLRSQLEEEYNAIQMLQTSYEEEHELIVTLQSHVEEHDEVLAEMQEEIKDLNEEMNNKLDWGHTSPSGDGDDEDNDNDDDPDDDNNDDGDDNEPVGKI